MTDPIKLMTDEAKERTVRHLYHLGYKLEQIARVTGMELDKIVRLTSDLLRTDRAG